MRWAALLKGVNVGGNRRLPMADLRRFVESRGGSAVATLLASGNVVFDHPQEDADVLADHFRAAARDAIGIDTPWLLRSHDEIAAILEGNPFPAAARDRPQHLLVIAHRMPVPQPALDLLAATYDGPERWTAIGRELFIDFVESIGTSMLPAAMARARFPTEATGRNWNTLAKLAELTAP